jgi:hypothetical protein
VGEAVALQWASNPTPYRQFFRGAAHAGIAGTSFKLFPTVSAQISAVRPDILAIVAEIVAITPDVPLVTANIALFAASCSVISLPNILAHHAPVFRNVTTVAANVTPVTPPVGPAMAQVAAITLDAPPVDGCVVTQSKNRSQHCKAQQRNNSSSHIASLASGLIGLCGVQTHLVFQSCWPDSAL